MNSFTNLLTLIISAPANIANLIMANFTTDPTKPVYWGLTGLDEDSSSSSSADDNEYLEAHQTKPGDWIRIRGKHLSKLYDMNTFMRPSARMRNAQPDAVLDIEHSDVSAPITLPFQPLTDTSAEAAMGDDLPHRSPTPQVARPSTQPRQARASLPPVYPRHTACRR